MEFESASPPVVKSIKQRDLLNYWLRLYAKHERLPKFSDYLPERIAEEADDLVSYTVQGSEEGPRFRIDSEGTRMSSAYGTTGQGRYLDEYLGAKLEPIVMPIYHECVRRRLPIYTISKVNDLYGRKVDYERLIRDQKSDARERRPADLSDAHGDRAGFVSQTARPDCARRRHRIRLARLTLIVRQPDFVQALRRVRWDAPSPRAAYPCRVRPPTG